MSQQQLCPSSSSSSSTSFDLLYVDDFYFSLLFDQHLDQSDPISDSQYAEELQFQESLLSSLIHAPPHAPSLALLPFQAPVPEAVTVIQGESSHQFCEICVERKEPEEMMNVDSCAHSFCTDCVTKYVNVKVEEGSTQLSCPAWDCEGTLKFETCREILPKWVVEEWDDALCKAVVMGKGNFYCPFKDCSALLVIESDDDEEIRESECPYCHRLFCAKCGVSWHSGYECGQLEGLCEDEKGREDLMMRELAKERKWMRCPKCRFYVERIEGCPHMTCRFEFEFCFDKHSLLSMRERLRCGCCLVTRLANKEICFTFIYIIGKFNYVSVLFDEFLSFCLLSRVLVF